MYALTVLFAFILSTCIYVRGSNFKCTIEKINILGEDNLASSVDLEIIVNDPQSCKDNTFMIRISPTNQTAGVGEQFLDVKGGNGTYTLEIGGTEMEILYKNRVVSNRPFYLPGTKINPQPFYLQFMKEYVELQFQRPDKRVKSWTLIVYKSEHPEKDTPCPSNFTQSFKRMFKWPNLGNNSRLRKDHNFSAEGCYCFAMKAEGYNGTNLGAPMAIINRSCKPQGHSRNPDKITDDLLVVVTPIVVIGTLVMCGLAIAIRYIRRKRNYSAPVCQSLPLLNESKDVLVVYAKGDESHTEMVSDLIRRMRMNSNRQVYDLHNCSGGAKINDPNEWLRERIKEGRVIIILSPILSHHLRVVFDSDLDTGTSDQETDPFLVYALKSIPFNDYSKVFVARFHESDQGNVEGNDELAKVITMRRRYDLPENLEALRRDLFGITELSIEDNS